MQVKNYVFACATAFFIGIAGCQKVEDSANNAPKSDPYPLEDDHQRPTTPNSGGSSANCRVYKWQKKIITWRLIDAYPDADINLQKAVIRKSFQRWSDLVPLTFEESNSEADIEIRFTCGDFCDTDSYGKVFCQTLDKRKAGWGFYPPSLCAKDEQNVAEGNIYLTSCTNFLELHSGATYSLELLVTHEIGHALGLGHNPDNQSVMYEEASVLSITNLDKSNIQSLYGVATTTTPTPSPVPTPTPQPPTNSLNLSIPVGGYSSDSYSDFNTCNLIFFTGVRFRVISVNGNKVTIRVSKYSTGSFQQSGNLYIKQNGICGTALYTKTYQAGGDFDYTFTIFSGQTFTVTCTSTTSNDRFHLGDVSAY